jgi:hypothetical protein
MLWKELLMMDTFHPKKTPWQITEQDFPHEAQEEEKVHFLLRYAILAPSSHNTQPWIFVVNELTVHVFADLSRWLKVADADQRELHISIGCALENLLIAAEYFGYGYQVDLLPNPDTSELMATVFLLPGEQAQPLRDPALFAAIPSRHTNHKVYDGNPIPAEDLRRLEQCIFEESIVLHMTDDDDVKRRAEEIVTRGDAMQFADPAYREELGYWIGQGVFGSPWLLAKMGQLAVTHLNLGKNIAKKDSEVLMSSPVLAVLTSQRDDTRSRLLVGQVYQRLALTATLLGIHFHPMSQPLELPELKQELARLLPHAAADGVVQHAFRMGYAEPEGEHTPRRRLEEVMQ